MANTHQIATVRFPSDERLAEVAKLGPLGWWKEHAGNEKNICCRTGEPGCDVGDALFRLHSRELARRRS